MRSELKNYRCFDFRYLDTECESDFSLDCFEGVFSEIQMKMCLQDSSMRLNLTETFSSVASKCPTGATVRSVLRRAMLENRLTIGLYPAIQRLSQCGGALFCFTAEAAPGDSLNHMQEVLLEAFCAENGIFIVKVDSVDKLRDLIGCYHHRINDFGCVLVHQPYDDNSPSEVVEKSLSESEKSLIEHCQCTWGLIPQPVVRLPEK